MMKFVFGVLIGLMLVGAGVTFGGVILAVIAVRLLFGRRR